MPLPGRRLHHEDEPFLNGRQPLEQVLHDGGRRLLLILGALLERIERDEDGPGVRRVGEGGAGKADDVDGVRDAGHLERDFDCLPVDFVRARERGCRRGAV